MTQMRSPGIEPGLADWKSDILPLNYGRDQGPAPYLRIARIRLSISDSRNMMRWLLLLLAPLVQVPLGQTVQPRYTRSALPTAAPINTAKISPHISPKIEYATYTVEPLYK